LRILHGEDLWRAACLSSDIMNRRALALGLALGSLALAGGCTAPASPEASAESNIEGATTLTDSSALRAKVEEVGSIWADENIMSGHASVHAMKMTPTDDEAALVQAAKDVFLAQAEEDAMELEESFEENVEPTSDDVTARVGRVVAIDGFVFFDAPGNIDPKIEEVRSIVALVGEPSSVAAVTIAGTGFVPWDGESPLRTTTFLFVNKTTGDAAAFFVREGSK
jgi:hypothetical protein